MQYRPSAYFPPSHDLGAVFTISGASGLGDAAGPCVNSGCRATDLRLQQLKDAAEALGWPAAFAAKVVAADTAWQAIKSSSANPLNQAILDAQRTILGLLDEAKALGAGGGRAAAPPTHVRGSKTSFPPRWLLYLGGAAAAIGVGAHLLGRRRGLTPPTRNIDDPRVQQAVFDERHGADFKAWQAQHPDREW